MAFMRLLFLCFSPVAMDVDTPEREPLGGTESSAAYLARQLAKNGHDVSFAARLPPGTPERVKGVRHVQLHVAARKDFMDAMDFDAVIALSAPRVAQQLKQLAPKALHVCWLHLLPNESAMAPLASMAPYIDCAVFVSQTQAAMFRYQGRWAAIGNGIAPAFENMFASAEEMRGVKENRAAYTSMPYRGLHVLVETIHQSKSGTRFDIYSAMKTYRGEEAPFLGLYDRVKAAPRTHYHGAVAQPVLAGELKTASFLAYPCCFIETYCIAALEAIAAGLKVVALDMGALKETTLGFADLLPVTKEMADGEVVTRYTAQLENNVAAFLADPAEWAAARFEQSRAVNNLCSWRTRAGEWEALLSPAVASRR
jgi:glycosyltransferase involved in cell wall biosynthesis